MIDAKKAAVFQRGRERRKISEEKQKEWVEKWQTSGLTCQKFCKAYDLVHSVFLRWRRKFLFHGQEPEKQEGNWCPVHLPEGKVTDHNSITIEILLSTGSLLRSTCAIRQLIELLQGIDHAASIIR